MRWKCVAWLVTVLSAACAQKIIIEDDIHLQYDRSTTPQPITQASSELLRDITIDEKNNSGNPDTIEHNSSENENNQTSTEGPNVEEDNETDENDSDPEEPEEYQNVSQPANSTESQEVDSQGSNEVVDENENGSDHETGGGGPDNTPDCTTPGKPDSNENGGEQSTETEEKEDPDEDPGSRTNEVINDEAGDPIETEGGFVQGYYLHGDSGIRSFIDIPYGTFSGLFQAPTKADKWEKVHQVKEHDKRCPQIDEGDAFAGSIDCLTLSVFAPTEVENAAVLFHIYDGDFHVGSGDPNIYGPEYLVSKGIVLVLPNYRLGALGFLCLNNDIAPGNAGLKDLTLALEWVENNIAKFGGNPSKIVVSGDGRSAALPGYLALSPMSSPYISGVIAESGSMLAHWAIDRDTNTTAKLFIEAVEGAVTNDVQKTVLAAKDINFRPCTETGQNAFMNATPWQILNTEGYKTEIPFIIGSANHAGLQEAMVHTDESLTKLNENFTQLLPDDLKFRDGEKVNIANRIKIQYFGDKTIGLEDIVNISLCYTDAYYLGPAIRASRALVKAGAKVYFFEFSFVGELNRVLGSLPTKVSGAARGDLVSYIFTQDEDTVQEGSDEERMVDVVTDLWVSFIRTGIPSAEKVDWKVLEAVAEAEEQWLSIDTELESKTGLHVNRLALWTEVYDKHFIETNLAIRHLSSLYLISTTILVLGFRKDLIF